MVALRQSRAQHRLLAKREKDCAAVFYDGLTVAIKLHARLIPLAAAVDGALERAIVKQYHMATLLRITPSALIEKTR